MSLRCKILGHDWHEFQQTTKVQIEAINNSHMSIPAMTMDLDLWYRKCNRCHKKQERKHFTGKPTDWSDCQLTKDEAREKKLKELGIQ